jgi:hypothetical protein
MLAEIHGNKIDDITIQLVSSIAELSSAKHGDLD